MSHPTWFLDLGRKPYQESYDLQKEIQSAQIDGKIPSLLIFVEHNPVITVSKRSTEDEIVAPKKVLERRGIEVAQTDRGGQVTYHGPGQIVAYLLFDLEKHGKDLHEFLRRLEESIINVLAKYDLKGYRSKGRTGVWVGKEKICAMGIHVRRWWTTHGLALNVNTDLNHFGLIIPCGIRDRGVTSFQQILEDKAPSYEQAKTDLKEALAKEFDLEFETKSFDEVKDKLDS